MTDFAHIQSSMYDTCLYCSHGLNTWPMNVLICMYTYITYVVKLQYIAAGITYMGTYFARPRSRVLFGPWTL
jgi:hypothetical protein